MALRSAACVLLIVLVPGGRAAAQSLTLTRQDVASYAGARATVTGDFDRDGWMDLAHANYGRNTVTILLNQGGSAPNFVRASDVPVGAGPFDLVAGDFNRDGILDLAVANADAHTVSILRGQAAGGFSRTDVAAPRGPRGIAAADVNEDGRLDLVVTGWDSHAVRVLLGNGAGAFSSGPLVSGQARRPQGVATADFNRDGQLDLIVAHESAAGLVVLTGNGGTAFTARTIPGRANLNVLTVGDLNRDGWMDVSAASSSGNRVATYLGGGSGLRFHREYATGASPRGIVASDLNHDGALDLITANRTGSSVSVLLGRPEAPGFMRSAQHVTAGAGSRAVVAEDFDRDGRIDVATGNQFAETATVLWNDTAFDRAAFSFGRRSYGTPSSSSGGFLATPADFNEDGKLDVVVVPDFTLGRIVQVLLTDGPVVTLEAPRYRSGPLVEDLNGDGHSDVLLVQPAQPSEIWSYLGNGRGAFTKGPQAALADYVFGVVPGDLNRDSTVDLAYTAYDRSLSSYVIQVLIGRGDGSFQAGRRVPTGTAFTSALTIADVNRDGRLDAAVFVGGDLAVFHGDGAGNLHAGPATTVAPYTLQRLELADLNHDGWLDAVAGEQRYVRVSLNGLGGFGTADVIEIDGYSNWSNVAVADISLDGNPDIVGSAGFILRGRGDGTFLPQEHFDYDSPSVHVVDFTRDGLPDIVMPTTDGAFDVFVNTWNGVNRVPTVDAGPDRTFEYHEQFLEGSPSIQADGRDADLHKLWYDWRDQTGNLVERASGPWLEVDGLLPGSYTYTVTVRDGRGGSATDSVRVTIAPTKEIVVWSASGFYDGTFSEVADATAAGGERGYDRNLGRGKVTTPLGNPPNRISLGFVADPTQTYKLWVRLKADGNHWSNDSVWVQFSGAADAQGNPIYRFGTASGLAVNLEECAGCGVSGWGWEDDGWGAVDRHGVTLRFPAGGHQSIVIQTREDGVSIDQVVLSSERYLTTRPGAAKNDGTILQWTFWQEEG